MPSSGRASRAALRPPMSVLACALAVTCLAQAPAAIGATTANTSSSALTSAGSVAGGQDGQGSAPGTKAIASATLEQCVAALVQTERAATFAGEMTAVPGTVRMEMSIGVAERIAGEAHYRAVSAPGLGTWRSSDPGVKVYTHIQQVTNLSAPAFYRGDVRFRWLNAKGRVIKFEELHTARCEQPAPPATTGSSTGSTGETTSAPSA
jgi:hypothetical protein